MKKIGVIVNCNAKKIRNGRNSIDRYMKYNSDSVFINKSENINELKEIIRSYRLKEIEYICIAGGDGTLHLVLSELLNIYTINTVPPILILKEGTMNNIAHSINLKGNGPGILKRFLKIVEKNGKIETEDRYTIKILDKHCFLFGAGFVTNFLNKVYSGKEKGVFRNLQVGLMSFKELFIKIKDCEIFKLTEQAIFIDEKKVLINPVSGILAGTVEYIGMGFTPLINAVQTDSCFQVIVIGLNPRGILRYLNKIRKGIKIKSPRYLNVLGKTILMKQKGIFEYTMDGEIYFAENELIISIGPKIKLVKI